MRRFLQGLGVGIFAATLVFTVSYYAFGNKKMSDSEVISRAKKLGMIQPTEAPIFNTENPQTQTSGEAVSGDGNMQQPQATFEPQMYTEATVQPQTHTDATAQPQNEASADSQKGGLGENDSAGDSDNSLSDGTVKIKINEGDGATAVAFRLQQLGIIDDAVDYDRYLRNNSYSHTIQIGTFNLRAGMSYEEITSVITSGI